MTSNDLGHKLKEMCDKAPEGEKVAMIHLFGIKYANEIRGCSVRDIVHIANLPDWYKTEIAKGVKLSGYVCLK